MTRDANESMEKIINAAKDIFAEKGFYKTTLAEIGKKCNLSKTTPLYFYGSKEKLYRAVINKLIKEENEFVSQLNFSGDVSEEVLREVFLKYMDYTYENPYLCKIFIRESLYENTNGIMGQTLEDMTKWYKDLLIEAKKNGGIRHDIDLHILLFNAMLMAWLPIITAKTFMRFIDEEFYSEKFIEIYKNQASLILFEAINSGAE